MDDTDDKALGQLNLHVRPNQMDTPRPRYTTVGYIKILILRQHNSGEGEIFLLRNTWIVLQSLKQQCFRKVDSSYHACVALHHS